MLNRSALMTVCRILIFLAYSELVGEYVIIISNFECGILCLFPNIELKEHDITNFTCYMYK